MIATASRKNALTFASIQIPGSLFHFPHHRKILRDLLAVLTQSPAGFRDTRRNDKVMNPHFERDPGDIWIWIRINPEIQVRILDYFWLRLDALAEVFTI